MASSRLLAVLTSDPDGPVVRHRWRSYEDALARAGTVLEVVAWPKERGARRRALHRVETADGVIVSSRLVQPRHARALRRRTPHLAFDFDDALWLRDSARGARPSRTRQRRFRALVRAADQVFAGNEYLAALALRHGATVDVLPTVVDVPTEEPPPPPPPPPVVLGWIGSRSTLPYLQALWVVLSAVVATGRTFKLRVVADAFPRMPPGIAVEAIPWTEGGWRHALGGIHVGLAPLPEDPWTRGKCGLKVLQVMSVGRPVVASAVGVQAQQVRHGVTGLLARSDEQFFDALLTLLDDAEFRARMGRAASAEVRAAWSVEAWSPRVVAAVDRWLGGRGARAP